MKKPLIVFVLCVCAPFAMGLDITTLDGKFYRDCEVRAVKREGLSILHRDGAAFVPFDTLPSDLQKQYGWTPEKSAALKAEKLLKEKEAKDREAAAAQLEEKRKQEIADALKEKQVAEMRVEAEKVEARREQANREAEARRQKERTESIATVFSVIAMIFLGVAGLCLYFLPTILGRKKENAIAIFAMNLFLGWIFIGWVIALVWALTKDAQPVRPVIVQNIIMKPPQPRAVPRAVATAKVISSNVKPLPPKA